MWGRSVRAVLAAAVLAVAAAPAHAAVPATSLTAADYLAFADRLQVALNPAWDAKAGAYRTSRTLFVRVNAALLYAHANAALAGHTGASRQDARARSIVRLLTQAPAFRFRASNGPAWTSRIDWPNTPGHFSLDPKVAEALAAAYQARARIGLPATCSAASATASRSSRGRRSTASATSTRSTGTPTCSSPTRSSTAGRSRSRPTATC